MKDELLELINLELQAMTDCSDIINYAELEKIVKLYCYQNKRFYQVTNSLKKLTSMYIQEFKEIPKMEHPTHNIYELPYVHTDDDIMGKFFTVWVDLEKKILEQIMILYNESKLNYFKRLYQSHNKYREVAEKCSQKYSISPEVKVSARERLKAKLESNKTE